MKRALAIAVLLGGLVLLFAGVSAMDSLGSDLSRFFTGAPTDKAVWLLVAGVVATVTGLALTLRHSGSG